jgi:hypothetical protein
MKDESTGDISYSEIGNMYYDSAYVTVKSDTDLYEWPLTCIQNEDN